MSTPSHAAAPDFDPAYFRQALSRFATGVTVVTTRAPDDGAGKPVYVGLTASSFNSVSLAPPLVLWSLSGKARSMPLFRTGSHYVINVLGADQVELCQHFATATGDRFEGVPYRLGASGLPILDGAIAWFECHNRSRHQEGDHVIFVGEVEHCGYAGGERPLVFQLSRFATTMPLSQSED